MRRDRSSQPEPKPLREEGYYWIIRVMYKDSGKRKPEIAYYCASTTIDQEPGSSGERIISEYGWWCAPDYAGDDGWVSEEEVRVLWHRLEPPADRIVDDVLAGYSLEEAKDRWRCGNCKDCGVQLKGAIATPGGIDSHQCGVCYDKTDYYGFRS